MKRNLDISSFNNYEISKYLVLENIKSLDISFFKNIPNRSKIDKTIKIITIIPSYFLVVTGIIALVLLFAFLALYCLHIEEWYVLLISGIVFAIIFFIGYFAFIFSYSFYIKNKFKYLKYKFKDLQKNNFIISDINQYPDLIQIIEYNNEPNKWIELNKKIPKFSYYVSVVGLIDFFDKLSSFIKNDNSK